MLEIFGIGLLLHVILGSILFWIVISICGPDISDKKFYILVFLSGPFVWAITIIVHLIDLLDRIADHFEQDRFERFKNWMRK